MYIKACERIYVNSRKFEDLTEKGRQKNGARLVEEMIASAKALPQIHMLLNVRSNRIEIHKFAFWITRLINHIDEVQPEILYLLPESFLEIPFEFFRAAFRGGIPLYDSAEEQLRLKDEYDEVYQNTSSSFSKELIKFISKHFFDPKIANPDLKDIYLTRLNIIMQKQIYVDLIEQCANAQENLVPLLMKSFDKRYLQLVSKNFLRFWKGRGFKEVQMPHTISENTVSEFYILKLRKQLMAPGDKLAKDFMNNFFNILNELTTELFVIFKELKNSYNP